MCLEIRTTPTCSHTQSQTLSLSTTQTHSCLSSQVLSPPPMADYEDEIDQQNQPFIPKETALQALNTIIQLHFEKTLEKKRAIDHQKKKLHKLFQLFFIFLALIFFSLSQPSGRLGCRHCWAPIVLLSFSHLFFYVSVAQTLRCINGFKYQRRCHKLTLGLATHKLRFIKSRIAAGDFCLGGGGEDEVSASAAAWDLEVPYQEPPDSYFGKFKRNWALYFGFLILLYTFMISFSVVILCF
uniref:Transmembrane protein n=2 Tax=Brassica oleracea var. oleracea TaxID=109376 RepID=A0A0D3CIQ5_BRAOL